MSESENEYDDTEQHARDDEYDDKMAERNATSEGADANSEVKKTYDPKDPLRPRRKKARRACFACQRAHLTCGKSSFRGHITKYTVPSLKAKGMAGAFPQYGYPTWLVLPSPLTEAGEAYVWLVS
jgi:hypothetical protein